MEEGCPSLAGPPGLRHLNRAALRTPQGFAHGPDLRQHRPLGRREAGELPMTAATWITMLVIMSFVWGGFSLVLLTAIRKESGKGADG
jgi:hypothetical protein